MSHRAIKPPDAVVLARNAVLFCLRLGPSQIDDNSLAEAFEIRPRAVREALQNHAWRVRHDQKAKMATAAVWCMLFPPKRKASRVKERSGRVIHQRDLAAMFGCSDKRIHAIEQSAMSKIRAALNREVFGESDEKVCGANVAGSTCQRTRRFTTAGAPA